MQGSPSAAGSKVRFSEPAKFLPIGFICVNIAFLWTVYMVYHCIPLMQEPATSRQGIVQTLFFNFVFLMQVICYVLCITTHPGTIPDTDETGLADWSYVPHEPAKMELAGGGSHETKRSGDRRHCKWCAKFKPDRCHHCRVCRTCVLKMDHHCPWIYNCVGFSNHKYFFLLLCYSVIACHIIVWTMYGSVKLSVNLDTEFFQMFLMLFGETLATLWAFLITLFLMFHTWLMLKAMTTIEFCEKSMKRMAYDSNAYDRGLYGNIRSVLGDDPLFWFCPCSLPSGDGLSFTEEAPLLGASSKDVESGRATRKEKQMGDNATHKRKLRKGGGAGTGECGDSDGLDSSDGFA